MSIILEGSKRVKGHASKTKWKQRSLALTRDCDHKYFTEIYCCTIIYILEYNSVFARSLSIMKNGIRLKSYKNSF